MQILLGGEFQKIEIAIQIMIIDRYDRCVRIGSVNDGRGCRHPEVLVVKIYKIGIK